MEIKIEETEISAGGVELLFFRGVLLEEVGEGDFEERGGGDVGGEGWERGEILMGFLVCREGSHLNCTIGLHKRCTGVYEKSGSKLIEGTVPIGIPT